MIKTSARLIGAAIGLAFALLGGAAAAHVGISPAESRLGKKETYTLTVPTEGTSPTVAVELDVPDEVTMLSVQAPAAEYTVTREGERIVRIAWRVDIPPGASKRLAFVAQNPPGPIRGIRWKVRQLFADGSRADWVELPPARPAPSTRLLAN